MSGRHVITFKSDEKFKSILLNIAYSYNIAVSDVLRISAVLLYEILHHSPIVHHLLYTCSRMFDFDDLKECVEEVISRYGF